MNETPSHRTNSGFTLIEVLIVSGLLAVIFISVSSLFLTSLASGLRTTLWQELRSEGTAALTQVSYLLRNSSALIDDGSGSICSPSSSSIAFDNQDSTKSKLSIIDGTRSNKILVVETIPDTATTFTGNPSTYLTSDETDFQVNGSNPFFACHQTGEQPYVTITFQLLKETESINPVTQQFRRTIFLRNSQ